MSPIPESLSYPLIQNAAAPVDPATLDLTSDVVDLSLYNNLSVQVISSDIGAGDSLQMEQSINGVTWTDLGIPLVAAGVTEFSGIRTNFARGHLLLDTSIDTSVFICAKP